MGRGEETIQSALVGFSFKVDAYWCCGDLSSQTFRFKGIVNFPKASKLMMQKKFKEVHSSSLFPLLCFLIG